MIVVNGDAGVEALGRTDNDLGGLVMSTTGPTGTAIVLQRLSPRAGADARDLENFIVREVFASVDTSGGDGSPDTHMLLDAKPDYIWMSRLEYAIHATPLPTWLLDRVAQLEEQAQTRVGANATISTVGFHYDVAAWRHIPAV
jgi:hypothetical protein